LFCKHSPNHFDIDIIPQKHYTLLSFVAQFENTENASYRGLMENLTYIVDEESAPGKYEMDSSLIRQVWKSLDNRMDFFKGPNNILQLRLHLVNHPNIPKEKDMEEYERLTVLVVENDTLIQGLIKHILSKQYQVNIVASGEEMRKALLQIQADIILMDIGLDGDEDGYSLIQQLRAQEEYKTTPIIVITAYVGDNSKERSYEVGCDDFLSKPFRPLELAPLIDKHVDKKGLKRKGKKA